MGCVWYTIGVQTVKTVSTVVPKVPVTKPGSGDGGIYDWWPKQDPV